MSVGVILKFGSAMPHFHQSTDDSFGLAVGLGPVDLSKLLADTMGFASLDESRVLSAFILFAIVGISVINLVRTLRE
jgi:hypothetical protein